MSEISPGDYIGFRLPTADRLKQAGRETLARVTGRMRLPEGSSTEIGWGSLISNCAAYLGTENGLRAVESGLRIELDNWPKNGRVCLEVMTVVGNKVFVKNVGQDPVSLNLPGRQASFIDEKFLKISLESEVTKRLMGDVEDLPQGLTARQARLNLADSEGSLDLHPDEWIEVKSGVLFRIGWKSQGENYQIFLKGAKSPDGQPNVRIMHTYWSLR